MAIKADAAFTGVRNQKELNIAKHFWSFVVPVFFAFANFEDARNEENSKDSERKCHLTE